MDARFRKGYLCEAVWPGDEEWYPAKIVRLTKKDVAEQQLKAMTELQLKAIHLFTILWI